MASLQDQLLKAGLTDQNKAKKAHKDKHKQAKAARKTKQQGGDQTMPGTRQDRVRRVERDRELNRLRQEQADVKAVTAQIMQLIQMNKVNRASGEISYSFIHHKKVRKIYLTEELKAQLGLGQLAIVSVDINKQTGYELVPVAVAEKIAQRDGQRVVQIDKQEDVNSSESDPYGDYLVPDDLMW